MPSRGAETPGAERPQAGAQRVRTPPAEGSFRTRGGREWPARAGAATLGRMEKWEYATVPLMIHATKQILDNWGEDGWELVTVLPGAAPAGDAPAGNMVAPQQSNPIAYFKRRREA